MIPFVCKCFFPELFNTMKLEMNAMLWCFIGGLLNSKIIIEIAWNSCEYSHAKINLKI